MPQTKIIIVNGSPRKKGNSTPLARAVVEGAVAMGAEELPMLHIESMSFRGCQNCGGCNDTGHCIVKDDMQTAYAALAEADVWVFASPIYFDTISGQLKLFYDRLFCFSKKKLEGNRKSVFAIAYEMDKNDAYAENMKAYQGYLKWFADFTESHVISVWGMAKKGDILDKQGVLENARKLGRELVQT